MLVGGLSRMFKEGMTMREVTKLLIRDFNIKYLGYDFMGYSLQKGDIYTFHHLIVPNREGGGYEWWNGAILCGKSSHPYLHVIENKDYDMFCYLTSEMIDMKIKGYLDMQNIRNIHDVLCEFEREHCSEKTYKDKYLIKEEYTKRLLKR